MSHATPTWRLTLARQYQYWQGKFHKLSERDQQALIFLGSFTLCLVLIYSVIIPAVDYRSNARESFIHAQQLLNWMKAQQPAVLALKNAQGTNKGTPKEITDNPITLINTSAKNFNLSIKRLQPESNGNIRIWMEQVSFNNTIRWLDFIQQQGLKVDDISLDQQSPGIVNIRATFR